MIFSRASWGRSRQAAISSMVRKHPVQWSANGSSLQTEMQGEAMWRSGLAGASDNDTRITGRVADDEPVAYPRGPVSSGHRQTEHTADLALEIWADTEEALLVEGARALIEIMTEGESIQGEDRRTFELESLDREDRLVRWLNEVLVAAVSSGFLLVEVRELELREDGLFAIAIGRANAGDLVRAELKAATYHDLKLENDVNGWRARVVIDV